MITDVIDWIVMLPASFQVWLAAGTQADFLKGRFLWANWDVEELLARREEIEGSLLLKVQLTGVPMETSFAL
jgi:hypothetical protein